MSGHTIAPKSSRRQDRAKRAVLPGRQHEAKSAGLIIDPNAEPPADKFIKLSERIPEFLKTWERCRRGKWTGATYQVKLAHYAVDDDWIDQDIANLIIKFRRIYGDDLEPSADYYLQIIARAKLDRVCASKQEARELVSTLIGMEIKKIQRYLTDPPTYVLTIDTHDRPIQLGDSNSLTRQDGFRKVLFDYGRYTMLKFKGAEWHQIVSRMTECIEDVQASEEGTYIGSTTQWVMSYLRAYVHAERVEEAQRQAILSGNPGMIDGDLWFPFAGLKRHVKVEFGENPSAGDLAVRLQQIGCQYVAQKFFRTEDKHHCRSLWWVPPALAKELGVLS